MAQQHRNRKLMDCVSNPTKCRILLEVLKQGTATAKQLTLQCADIPQTTLYRNLKRMTEDGILTVVNETPIRGTVEKTYAPAFDWKDPAAMLGEDAGTLYLQLFFQYILTFAKQFQTYCDTPDIDVERGRSGFSLSHLYLSDEELECAVGAISKILSPLQSNRPAEGRKLRTIGLIVSPAQPDTEEAP